MDPVGCTTDAHNRSCLSQNCAAISRLIFQVRDKISRRCENIFVSGRFCYQNACLWPSKNMFKPPGSVSMNFSVSNQLKKLVSNWHRKRSHHHQFQVSALNFERNPLTQKIQALNQWFPATQGPQKSKLYR